MSSSTTNSDDLVDHKVNVKFKLSALWVAVMFCYVYGDFFTLFLPDRIESLMDGQMGLGATSPLKLLAAATVMAVPSLMIFFSLMLKPRTNRWTNISLGAIYSVIMILVTLNSLDPWKTYYIFFGVVEITLTTLIGWYAWKWPKQSAIGD